MKPIVHLFNSSIVSGPETLVLPALPAMKRRVVVIFLAEGRREAESRGPIEYARSLGLEAREIPVRSRLDLGAIRALVAMLREIDPDVVHAHDVKASTYLLRASKKIPGRKFRLFSTHHGVRGRSGWKPKIYEQFYSRFILPAYDRVLTVCTSDREILVRRGLDPARVKVHLNGVDRKLVLPEDREQESLRIREAWKLRERGFAPHTRVLGFLGRIAPEKRLDRILEVCLELHRLDPSLEWRLVVFGRGPLETSLQQRTRELGLVKRVEWMGYRSGVGNELAGFDLLLSLSDAEGLPINLIEAGWAGTPVFATGVDGNRDLISSASEGWLIPPELGSSEAAGQLHRILKDDESRKSIGKKFQQRVREGFSGRRWLSELEAFYNEG